MKTSLVLVFACLALPLSAVAGSDHFVDEEWVIGHKDAHVQAFEMPASAVLHVDVTPVKNCDKGFTVRLVPAEDYDACVSKSQGRCRSRPGFDGFKVASLNHAELVPQGRWAIYVQNSENVLERATVHVRVSLADPGGR